jgi:hypothetical protein
MQVGGACLIVSQFDLGIDSVCSSNPAEQQGEAAAVNQSAPPVVEPATMCQAFQVG